LSLYADDKYPSSAPKVKFTSKISADFVDAKGNVSDTQKLAPEPMRIDHGTATSQLVVSISPLTAHSSRTPRYGHCAVLQVLPAKVPYLSGWTASKTMAGALNEIKGLIGRASRAQPADGTTY
jgi:ubiquitin-protein ligase